MRSCAWGFGSVSSRPKSVLLHLSNFLLAHSVPDTLDSLALLITRPLGILFKTKLRFDFMSSRPRNVGNFSLSPEPFAKLRLRSSVLVRTFGYLILIRSRDPLSRALMSFIPIASSK